MVLRKITIDKSVRYIPIGKKTKRKEIKPKTKEADSHPLKQIKKFHKIVKKNP